MEIKKPAIAGTLESSDCQVTVEKGEGNVDFSILFFRPIILNMCIFPSCVSSICMFSIGIAINMPTTKIAMYMLHLFFVIFFTTFFICFIHSSYFLYCNLYYHNTCTFAINLIIYLHKENVVWKFQKINLQENAFQNFTYILCIF